MGADCRPPMLLKGFRGGDFATTAAPESAGTGRGSSPRAMVILFTIVEEDVRIEAPNRA